MTTRVVEVNERYLEYTTGKAAKIYAPVTRVWEVGTALLRSGSRNEVECPSENGNL